MGRGEDSNIPAVYHHRHAVEMGKHMHNKAGRCMRMFHADCPLVSSYNNDC